MVSNSSTADAEGRGTGQGSESAAASCSSCSSGTCTPRRSRAPPSGNSRKPATAQIRHGATPHAPYDTRADPIHLARPPLQCSAAPALPAPQCHHHQRTPAAATVASPETRHGHKLQMLDLTTCSDTCDVSSSCLVLARHSTSQGSERFRGKILPPIRGSLPEVIRSWCAHHHHHHQRFFAGRLTARGTRTRLPRRAGGAWPARRRRAETLERRRRRSRAALLP